MSDSDDDAPALSAHALAALQQFYTEQENVNQPGDNDTMPAEDWQLSQFWYSDETAIALAKESISAAGDTGRIICLSCPTMYQKLRAIKPDGCTAILLEFDKRFEWYGEDFRFYDYNNPLDFPPELEKSFDVVVADPPFLSEECLSKTSESVKFLTKGKILLCTGAVMEKFANQYLGLTVCDYHPKHTRNLGNEFKCYANYETLHLNSRTN